MFKLENPYVDAVITFTNSKGKVVSFAIESIVNRRVRSKLKPDTIFSTLNKYLDYKGNVFRNELYKVLVKAKDTIVLHSNIPGTDNIPLSIVHDILDLFDFEDVKAFILKKRLVRIPPNLPVEYDISRELNGKGSRAQTYIKDDYVELITLTTILKATTCTVGNYSNVKDSILNKQIYKEYILFTLYRTHPLYTEQPIFMKIFESLEKLSERLLKNADGLASHIIGKGIPISVIPTYATAMVVINKLLLNDETEDNELRNTITKIYTYAPELLNLSENSTNKIIIKHNKVDDNSETTTSAFEPGNNEADCTHGQMAEFKFNSFNYIRLARQLGIKASNKDIEEMVKVFSIFTKDNTMVPIDEVITLTAWVLEPTIDPRATSYLEGEVFVNLALTVLWLYEHEYYDLALICTSIHSENNVFETSDTISIKFKDGIKEELDRRFPFMKQGMVNSVSKDINYAEVAIVELSKALCAYNMYSILPTDVLSKYYEADSKEVRIPGDIRTQLASLVIELDSIES